MVVAAGEAKVTEFTPGGMAGLPGGVGVMLSAEAYLVSQLNVMFAGETAGTRTKRAGAADLQYIIRLLRDVGSALAYLHDGGQCHGSVGPETIWLTPMGRIWMLGWQWAVPNADVPGLIPDKRNTPHPAEWRDGWKPSAL